MPGLVLGVIPYLLSLMLGLIGLLRDPTARAVESAAHFTYR